MKYERIKHRVVAPSGRYVSSGGTHQMAQHFTDELNTLLARAEAAEKRAEQAERDRDVLAKVVDQTMKSFGYFIDPAEYAVLSRCTPPASRAQHVCDYRCNGEGGHHAWPSPASKEATNG